MEFLPEAPRWRIWFSSSIPYIENSTEWSSICLCYFPGRRLGVGEAFAGPVASGSGHQRLCLNPPRAEPIAGLGEGPSFQTGLFLSSHPISLPGRDPPTSLTIFLSLSQPLAPPITFPLALGALDTEILPGACSQASRPLPGWCPCWGRHCGQQVWTEWSWVIKSLGSRVSLGSLSWEAWATPTF